MRRLGKWIDRMVIAGLVVLVCSPNGVFCQEDDEAALDRPLQIKDGLIQPQQRVWIPGRDGRPLMQYTLDELREMERVYREATQLPASLQSAEVRIQVASDSAFVFADFVAESVGRSSVKRFDLSLKSCQLVAPPIFHDLEAAIQAAAEQGSEGLAAADQASADQASEVQAPEDQEPENQATGKQSLGENDGRGALETLEKPSGQRVITTQDGYQWMMLTTQPGQHRVSLEAKTLVDRTSDRQSLTLDLPIVQASIIVELPSNSTDERVRSEDIIVSRAADESGVRLEIRSRGGPFTLSWRPQRAAQPIGAVEAKSETVYEPFDLLNLSQSWSATTTVSIRWVAGDGNQIIQIKLPPGGQWNNLPYSEFDRFRLTVQSLEAEQQDSESPAAEVLLIENLNIAELPMVENLSLQWRWMPVAKSTEPHAVQFSVRAPEITGVDSHDGTISVIYPGGFEFSYQEYSGTRFMEHTRSSDSGTGRHQLQFAFSSPQAGADILFLKQILLPTIRPTYLVHVREDRLELTAWMHCWFDGNPTEIGWFPSGWTLDEGSATQLRDPASLLSTNSDPLMVLRREDGSFTLSSREVDSSGAKQRVEQVWRLTAFRTWTPGEEKRIEFQLPAIDRGYTSGQPRIDSGAGVLLMTGENYLVLQKDSQASVGFWPDSVLPEYQIYSRSPDRPLEAFRFQQNDQRPLWVGKAVFLPQQISTELQVELEVREQQVQVDQHFDLRVANRPLDQLRLSVREDLLPIQVLVDGQMIPYEELAAANDPAQVADESGWREIRFVFSPKLLGKVRLTARSFVPWQPVEFTTPDDSAIESPVSRVTPVNVPLVQLLGIASHRKQGGQWTVRQSARYDIQYWQEAGKQGGSEPVGRGMRELASDQTILNLAIFQRPSVQEQNSVTQGVWLQTLLTGSERRDRYVARVRTVSEQIVVQLPEQALLDKVAVDGISLSNELAPYDYNSNQVSITLSGQKETGEKDYVVEVVYLLSEPLSWAHRFRMTPATVLDSKSHDRFYWQLVTPNIYHLGWCPTELTAEWRWQRRLFWWARESDLDQAKLERWIGAATLSRIPIGTNSYVMSSMEQPESIDVWVLSRFAFWLPTGIFTIGVGLLLLNLPILRTPTCLVLIAGVIAGFAVVWPEVAVLFGQTALAAMSLVVLALLTQAAVQSRVKRRSIFSSGSRSFQASMDTSISARSRQSSFSDAPVKPTPIETIGSD